MKWMFAVGLFAFLSIPAIASIEGEIVPSSDTDYADFAADYWTCKYQGKSGSTYFGTDQVREKAFNVAYNQCTSAKDTPCRSAGCEKH